MQEVILCPKCKTKPLKDTAIKVPAADPVTRQQDCRIDYCPQCKGLWFDYKELETVCPAACKDLRIPASAQKITAYCPRCLSQPLYAFTYPQTLVQIEMCPRCKGIWLDADEYKEIQIVRAAQEKEGKLRQQDPVPGMKGNLINLIEKAIDHLYSELFSW